VGRDRITQASARGLLLLEDNHRVALALKYILDRGARRFRSWQSTCAASACPSLAVRRFESVPIQCPAGIALEVRDCAVWIADISYYYVYVSHSNVGGRQVPTPVLTGFRDGIQDNPGPWHVQLIGFLGHDLPGILRKTRTWIFVTAAVVATRPLHPTALVTWNPCSIAVER